jgi:magnesium chelatase family protein
MGSTQKRCICKASDIDRYARKLSGPIMDRIDMWVPVLHINYDTLSHKEESEGSDVIRKRVQDARNFAQKRFHKTGGSTISKNKDMRAKDIEKHVYLNEGCTMLIKKLAQASTLSPRAYHRVLRLARTIADYRGGDNVTEADILEAFQYRPKLYQDRI